MIKAVEARKWGGESARQIDLTRRWRWSLCVFWERKDSVAVIRIYKNIYVWKKGRDIRAKGFPIPFTLLLERCACPAFSLCVQFRGPWLMKTKQEISCYGSLRNLISSLWVLVFLTTKWPITCPLEGGVVFQNQSSFVQIYTWYWILVPLQSWGVVWRW